MQMFFVFLVALLGTSGSNFAQDAGGDPDLTLQEAVDVLERLLAGDESVWKSRDYYRSLQAVANSGHQKWAPLLLRVATYLGQREHTLGATFYAIKHYWLLVEPKPAEKMLELVREYDQGLTRAVAAAYMLAAYPETYPQPVLRAIRLDTYKEIRTKPGLFFNELRKALQGAHGANLAWEEYQTLVSLEDKIELLRRYTLWLPQEGQERQQEMHAPDNTWARRELKKLSEQHPKEVAAVVYGWAQEARGTPLSYGRVKGWRRVIAQAAREELDELLPPEEWRSWGLK